MPLLNALDACAASLDGDTAAAVIRYLRDVAEVHRDYTTSSRRRVILVGALVICR